MSKRLFTFPGLCNGFAKPLKKKGSSVIFGHIPLQGITTRLSVPIMQYSLIGNLIYMDFQWDQIPLQAELNLPHGPG